MKITDLKYNNGAEILNRKTARYIYINDRLLNKEHLLVKKGKDSLQH